LTARDAEGEGARCRYTKPDSAMAPRTLNMTDTNVENNAFALLCILCILYYQVFNIYVVGSFLLSKKINFCEN
jgi:hypothetical protein